jgi:N-acetylglucosaminyl-diphospho-decaprenol L-rhamnosyltransferase
MGPDLDIVIVAYNSIDVIGGLLDSIPAAAGDLTYDLVVVDNGSTDGTPGFLGDRDDCRVICSTNTGYAGGINRGVRATEPAEAILILNADVRLQPESLPPLAAALEDPEVGIVAPLVRSRSGSVTRSLRREPTPARALGLNWTGLAFFSEYITSPRDYETPRMVDWALGAVLLMSRKCFDAIGGWDESFFLYSEETDACLRARDLGLLTRFEPRSVAIHIEGASGRDRGTHTMQIVNRVRLYHRRHGTPASWFYFGLTVISEISWLLRGHPRSGYAAMALLMPSRRPPAMGCSDHILPR